jgi:undecaprenyl-diphosphatase
MAGRGLGRSDVAVLVAGVVALVGSWVVVSSTAVAVPAWEASLFSSINGWPNGISLLLRAPMQLGSLLGALVVVAVTLVLSRNLRLTAAALVASFVSWWLAKPVKDIVSRARPTTLLTGVHLREHASGLGYPSGHAAVAFSLAAVLAPALPPRCRPVAWGLAVVVAIARLYVGAHLPLDVVGGAGLGVVVGTLTRWAFGLTGRRPLEHQTVTFEPSE